MTAAITSYKDFVVTPTKDWKIKQLVILSRLDAPRYGFVEFSKPVGCFYFLVVGRQTPANKEGTDEYLYQLHEASLDTVKNLIDELRYLHPVKTPVWGPNWQFPTEELRKEAEASVNVLIENAGESVLVVQSKDMQTFTGLWQVM